LQQREAQKSSILEGTITKPEQVLLFQLEPRYPESEQDPANAWREVSNYGKALSLAQEESGRLPISLRLIRMLHEVLMDGVRGANRSPGEFRRIPVQIDDPPRFVPPPPSELGDCLDALEKYIHSEHRYDPVVECFLIHYQFEAIHPFTDGNGRVGRVLLSYMIREWCNLSKPWLYMSAFFERNKNEYISRLLEISTRGAWQEWIDFCLRGVLEESRDTSKRCALLLELRDTYHARIAELGGSVRLTSIIDALFNIPITSPALLSRQHDVTYPTSKSDVDKLQRAGILVELDGTPRKTFYAPEIVDITYKDMEP
jgi:Fic family protein